jgi:ABC-type sugar transport system ATPase subunit
MGQALAREEAREAQEAGGRSAARGKPLLTVSGVACGYRTKDVSLSLCRGEIVGLAGLIGSGRSTLAKSLVGAVPLKAGRLELGGNPVRFKNPRQALKAGVALIPEDRRAEGLIGALPARENIVIMGLARSNSRFGFLGTRRLRRTADQAIARFEVRPADERRHAATFSGGNQQKLLLARAILADTEVLLIDQPTAGVDVGTKAQIHRILRSTAEEGRAILIISDEIDELLTVSDRLIVMRDGRMIAERDRGDIARDELIALISRGTANGLDFTLTPAVEHGEPTSQTPTQSEHRS